MADDNCAAAVFPTHPSPLLPIVKYVFLSFSYLFPDRLSGMKKDAIINENLRNSAESEQSDEPCETAILAALAAGAMSEQDIAQITGRPLRPWGWLSSPGACALL